MSYFNPTPVKSFDENSKARIAYIKNLPSNSKIHISGICGTGTGSVLSLLKQLGFYVSGSDKAFYPPMGEVVKSLANKVFEGFNKDNLKDRPDLVVIGNALSRNNPEVETVLEQNIPFCSMPEILSALLIGDRDFCPTSIVASGTHGKTTTTSLVASILTSAGRNPAYFIGGVPTGDILKGSIRAQDLTIPKDKRVCVLEGDEYDSAFFAKFSKFHCYRPDILIITNIDFDHADIFTSIEDIEREFENLIKEMPRGSHVIAYYEHERVSSLIKRLKDSGLDHFNVHYYGQDNSCSYQLVNRAVKVEGSSISQSITVNNNNKLSTYTLPLSGAHNADNALAAVIACSIYGLTDEEIKKGLLEFSPIKRRQQVIFNQDGVLVIEDFAHHPKEVSVTLLGLKEAYKPKRLIAVFEPRSNTSRKDYFKEDYVSALSKADLVILRDLDSNTTVYSGVSPERKLLPVSELRELLSGQGTDALLFSDVKKIFSEIQNIKKEGDLFVLMSNGDFGGLPGMFKV